MSNDQRVRDAADSPPDGDGADRASELSDLLSERRRNVLWCLASARTPMALADLTDELVRRKTGASPAAVQETRERVYVSLYHDHLPKLQKAGLVSFDMNRNLVGLRADGNHLPPTERANRAHRAPPDRDGGE